jgi:hypothetical protein
MVDDQLGGAGDVDSRLRRSFDSGVVVAAADLLDEGVPDHDHLCRSRFAVRASGATGA